MASDYEEDKFEKFVFDKGELDNISKKNDYIGVDGIRYPTYVAMVEANRRYWESVKINKNMYDIIKEKDILPPYDYIGVDGIRYPTHKAMVEANRRYWESVKIKKNMDYIIKEKDILPPYDYIGYDGRRYPTHEAMVEANRRYWESMKIAKNIDHIKKEKDILPKTQFGDNANTNESNYIKNNSLLNTDFDYIGADGNVYTTLDQLISADVKYWSGFIRSFIGDSIFSYQPILDSVLNILISHLNNGVLVDFSGQCFNDFESLAASNKKIWKGLHSLATENYADIADILENIEIQEKYFADDGKRCDSYKEVIRTNKEIWYNVVSFIEGHPQILEGMVKFYERRRTVYDSHGSRK